MPGRMHHRSAELLDALQSVLSQVAKPSQVLKTILSQAVSQTEADRGLFIEVSRSGELSYRVLYRFEREELHSDAASYSRSIFASVLKQRKGLRLANAMEDPQFGEMQSVQDIRLVSALCMPIEIERQIVALIYLERNRVGHFTEQHEQLLGTLLDLASSALATLRAGEGMLRERDALAQREKQTRKELAQDREVLARDWSFGKFVGRSPAVRELEDTLRRAARTEYPVLLLGETGTGKSILARVLHHSSPRSQNAFVTVFCPSLEKGMVETELFGHKRGAFTGAVADQVGKVQAADGGTLFLDEIGELPLDIQPKLLRLLQEKCYERVGDPTERRADARVIAATNRDLAGEVAAGRFRRDLYERLNFVPIQVPPLRRRREDIPLLLRHCLDGTDAGRWVELADEALQFLAELDFAWPGNVRHLEQLAARLAMQELQVPATAEDLRRLLGTTDPPAEAAPDPAGDEPGLAAGLPALLAREERKWIEAALRRYAGATRAEIAEKLKISESALYKKLRLYQID